MGDNEKDIRSKIEFLYDEVLSEVREIVASVATLRETLDASSKQAADRIAAAADDKAAMLLELGDAQRRQVEEQGRTELESIRLTAHELGQIIREQVRNGAVEGGAQAFAKGLQKRVDDAVEAISGVEGNVKATTADLKSLLVDAVKEIRATARESQDAKPSAASRAVHYVLCFLVITLGIPAGFMAKQALVDRPAQQAYAPSKSQMVWDQAVAMSWAKLPKEAQVTLNNAAAEIARRITP